MTKKDFLSKLKEYRLSDPEYAGTLSQIAMFCQEDYLPLFAQAESENKKLLLQEQQMPEGVPFEPLVTLDMISIEE
jgi:hypothetical protein